MSVTPGAPEGAAPKPMGADSSRSALPLVTLVGLVCLALSAGAFLLEETHGSAPDSPWPILMTVLGLAIVFGGAALGPLLWATPVVEPSALKLGFFASLLSPGMVAALFGAVLFGAPRVGWDLSSREAWAVTFLALGLLAFTGARSRLGRGSSGRAAGAAVALGIIAGAVVFLAAQAEPGVAARLNDRGTMTMVSLAASIQDGAPLVNPWTVGLGVDMRPGLAMVLAAISGPAFAHPMVAAGWLVAWSAGLLVIAGYLASAALFRECGARGAGLRDLVACLAVPGIVWVGDGSSWSPAAWLAAALAGGFLVAGLHAVRRGARPWPGLAAVLLAMLGCVHPLGAGALAIAFGIAGGFGGRWMLPPLGGLALLPGLIQGRVFGGFGFDPSAPYLADRGLPSDAVGRWGHAVSQWFGAEGAGPHGTIFTAGALGLSLIAVTWLAVRGGQSERRVSRLGGVFVWLVVGALAVLILLLPPTARGEGRHLVALGVLALGVAAGRALQALRSPALGLPAGALVLAALVVPRALAMKDLPGPRNAPFEARLSGLEFKEAIPMQVGLGEAAKYLRASALAKDPTAILLREPGTPGPVLRDEPISLAPMLFDIPLFGARVPLPGADQTRWLAPPRREAVTDLGDRPLDRRELLEALFEEESKWHPRFDRVLGRMGERGSTLVFLVTEADRRATTDRGTGPRGIDDVIKRLGAEAVFEGPEVTVYVWRPDR